MSRIFWRRALFASLVVALSLVSLLAYFRATTIAHVRAAPEIDPSYANGTTVYMIGPRLITNPNPNLLAQAKELYIAAYPLNSPPDTCTSNCPSLTLPSGYQPQCDPCFHPGLPPVFAYHDHILTGAPGFGTNGTAGSFTGPWQIIVMMYNPAFSNSVSFQPITSDEALDAAEGQGEFLPINPGPGNPYEIATGVVLICPLVSSHA
jgi:hypothetical protein